MKREIKKFSSVRIISSKIPRSLNEHQAHLWISFQNCSHCFSVFLQNCFFILSRTIEEQLTSLSISQFQPIVVIKSSLLYIRSMSRKDNHIKDAHYVPGPLPCPPLSLLALLQVCPKEWVSSASTSGRRRSAPSRS